MGKLIIYHGSPEIIKKPLYGFGKTYNDYGQGFYTTESPELAKEWSCNEGIDGYANKYEIEMDGLKVLNLQDNKYTILNWLAILMDNRKIRLSTPIAKKGKEYLLANFLPGYKNYDAIIGYRADDSYFSFARSFIMNEISIRQLGHAMRLGKLGEQFVLKSEKSFNNIKFLDYEIADNSEYYARRKKRDEDAREGFLKELENDEMDGIFMRDILREKIGNDDERLR